MTDPNKTIIVEVRSGVAHVAMKPAGLTLVVRDFDIYDDSADRRDADGNPYTEAMWTEGECV